MFKDTWIINIYAPSGVQKRQEGETFFIHDIAYLLHINSTEIQLAGDFNCVISPTDCTGKPNLRKALSSLIKVMAYMIYGKHTHKDQNMCITLKTEPRG